MSMKRLVPCVAGCLLAILAIVPSLAQDGPWVDVPDSPHARDQWGYALESSVQIPVENAIWSFVSTGAGMGVNKTKVMRSTDNGATWRDTVNFTTSLPVNDLWAIDGQHAWLIMDSGALQQTSEGPTGFKLARAQVGGLLRFIRFFTPSVGVLIGYNATAAGTWTIYRTTDGGLSWQLQADTPPFVTNSTPRYCTLYGNNIWVITEKAQLLHSADAGLTWTVTSTPTPFSQLSFRDAQHGLAYGPRTSYTYSNLDPPPLYRTADGGSSWNLVTPSGPEHWFGMTAVPGSAGTYLTVGKLGNSAYSFSAGTSITHDDGQTWQELGGKAELSHITADSRGNTWATTTTYGKIQRFAGTALATATPHTVAFSIYPNPTTGRVQLPVAGAYRQVAVFDAAGRQCCTTRLGPAETALDLSSLGAGIYLLRLDGGTAAPQQQRLVVTP
jgi:photosystem II stability/assembly factor-like uncharacterized protein